MQFDAIRIIQPSGRPVFAFAATADDILSISEISHIGRDGEGALIGYQRPEVVAHIAEIRRYLEVPEAVLPNSIVLAFDKRVRFETCGPSDSHGEYGMLHIPDVEEGQERPGFVVDGQQRLAALATCRHSTFPVFVTALVAPDVAEQRKQFVLVNRTKPLPEGLIFELLPEIDGCLPNYLARQRVAAQIVTTLNLNPKSSLHRRVRTPTCPFGMIKDNSLRRSVVNSLTDGALFDLATSADAQTGLLARMIELVSTYWAGVREAFPNAWELPPKSSRLTHGVGIVAMGYVMDHLYARGLTNGQWSVPAIKQSLELLGPYCAWTEGVWPLGDGEERPWNGLQNTDRDVRVLTNHFRRVLEGLQKNGQGMPEHDTNAN